MANPRIDVEIGAVIDGLKKGFGESVGIIAKLEQQALELDKALRNATTLPEIQNLNVKLAQTKSALSQLRSSGIEPLAKATSQYNVIGLDFARVIQDAPFGIIGVGNNIQQLAQSFSTLGNAGDSVTKRIKLAFGQIFSSGNLLILAVSAITTGLTFLAQEGFFKTEKEAKSLDEALKDYQETLTGVSAATLKGAQDAQKELAVLKSLEIQATNTAVSTDKRLEAVNQLQKQYPDYFGNLTKEQILNGEVGDAYLKVAANLLAKAKAQAATNQIAQNGIDLLRIETKLEEQRAKRLQETSAAQAQIDALIEKRQKDGFLTQGDLQRYDTLIKSINQSNESLKEEKSLKDEISRINKENESLTTEITKQIEAGATITGKSANSTKDAKKALDDYKSSWEEYNLQQESANFLAEKLNFSTKDYEKNIRNVLTAIPKKPIRIESDDEALQAFNDELYKTQMAAYNAELELMKTSDAAFQFSDNLSKISNQEVDIKVNSEEFGKELADLDKSKLSAFVVRLAEFNSQVSSIIQNGAQQTLGDFAFAIGDALASGGNVVKAAGAALLGGLAGILNQLGQLAIGAGLAIEGIKKALTTLNPAVAVAAGVALVALAGFVSSKAKSLGSAKPGGGVGGGSSVGSSGVGGGSSFVGGGQGGLFQSQRDLNGELVVRGQDLVYVFGQANNRINKG